MTTTTLAPTAARPVALPANRRDADPPLGRRFDVAGRSLALHRSGSGGPTVVFLPGAGLTGLDFLNVHAEVARFATAVIYDRGGTGWSDAAPLPRR